MNESLKKHLLYTCKSYLYVCSSGSCLLSVIRIIKLNQTPSTSHIESVPLSRESVGLGLLLKCNHYLHLSPFAQPFIDRPTLHSFSSFSQTKMLSKGYCNSGLPQISSPSLAYVHGKDEDILRGQQGHRYQRY